MNNGFRNNCGKRRGCELGSILPHDSRFGLTLSGVHGTSNDIQKVLSLAHISLDKKLEKEGQVEKMAA